MNNKQLEKKVEQDATKVKNDVSTLVGDSAARFGRFQEDVSQAADKVKTDVTTWIEDGASQLSEGFEKVSGDVRDSAVEAAAVVKKEVGHGLSQYNASAQKAADKVPGDFSKMVAKYSWVAITLGVFAGFLLGILLKPTKSVYQI